MAQKPTCCSCCHAEACGLRELVIKSGLGLRCMQLQQLTEHICCAQWLMSRPLSFIPDQ